LTIVLRRYHTVQRKQSKRQRQLLIRFYRFSFKELAITWSRPAPRPKAPVPPLLQLRLSSRTVVPLALIVVGLTGTVFFALNLHQTPSLQPLHPAAAAPVVLPPLPKTLPRSLPTTIRIPAINVDTSIVEVGRLADDSLELPNSYTEVGWYRDSPTPGELGPAIIAGHLDRPNNIAVFWRLRELKPGDNVEIDRADGSTARFAVTEIKEFSQDNFPTQQVYGNLNYVGLRLITCGGVFNPETHHYNENVVVYAKLL